MRSLVGIITTIATVIHFTFGCCLHPCHFSGHGEGATATVGSVGAEACCHDRLHDNVAHQPDTDTSGQGAEVEGVTLSASGACADCDACHGCQCACLSTEVTPIPFWSPLASGILSTVNGGTVPSSLARGGQPPPVRHPRSSRPALFERLLI
ncbi:MAG: hypothetical protein WCJ31_18320 [Planctomycetia bacterium]